MQKAWDEREIIRLSGAYWAACALHTAVLLDIFTLLDEGVSNEEELASRIQCDGRAFSMLITSLASMGFLERDGKTLKSSPAILELLSKKSPKYMGFIIKHHAHIMPAWTKLAQAVQRGQAVFEERSSTKEDLAEREAFLMGMFNVARLQAENVAKTMDFSRCKHLLDLGGGPGTYAIYFCLKNPNLSATVFDLPTTESFARKTIERFGLSGRIGFTAGNFLEDALPSDQDAAWLSQILHGETPEDASKLVAKAAGSLNPGGLLCIQEFMLDDDRNGPEHAALFSLNMLVQTPGGQAYTRGELEEMMLRAGLREISMVDVKLPGSCRIMVGKRP